MKHSINPCRDSAPASYDVINEATTNQRNTMNINDLTIGQAKELAALFQAGTPVSTEKFNPHEISKNYQIRTVTHIVTGQVVSVGETEIVLVDAAWVADTGRFADAVAKGEYNEVEPYPDGVHVVVGRTAVIDAVQIANLPRVQK